MGEIESADVDDADDDVLAVAMAGAKRGIANLASRGRRRQLRLEGRLVQPQRLGGMDEGDVRILLELAQCGDRKGCGDEIAADHDVAAKSALLAPVHLAPPRLGESPDPLGRGATSPCRRRPVAVELDEDVDERLRRRRLGGQLSLLRDSPFGQRRGLRSPDRRAVADLAKIDAGRSLE